MIAPVYLIIHKETLMVHGMASTEQEAKKVINLTNNFAIVYINSQSVKEIAKHFIDSVELDPHT